ncbi:BrnT family toxin [Hoeflea sp.]|uniref:BrnT family toxin n=1 Tax=Hoeflea sp. TaxID=1940281 RepID=UPI003749D5A7
MDFEWDDEKNKANIYKHGVSFETAARIFDGPVLTAEDDRFEYGEVRTNSIGMIENTLVLVVTHTDRAGKTRIISARPGSRAERSRYEQALQKRTQP